MAKTNWSDPGSTEVFSTHISGLQAAVSKLENQVDIGTYANTGISLTLVSSTHINYRIYQAETAKRNWLSSPAPVIKKNGGTITSGFTIDYGAGAIILTTPATITDVYTADATCISNIEDYGVLPGASVTEQQAINNATYINNFFDTNNRLVLTKGVTYVIGGEIDLSSKSDIVIEGNGGTIKHYGTAVNTYAEFSMFNLASASNIIFRNVIFDGNKAYTTTAETYRFNRKATIVALTGVTGLLIEGCKFLNTLGSCVYTQVGSKYRILHNEFTGNAYSPLYIIDGPNDTFICDNYIHDFQGVGIKIGANDTYPGRNITISSNTITNSIGEYDADWQLRIWSMGIECHSTVEGYLNNLVFSDNIIENCWDMGISISKNKNVSCSGNVIYDIGVTNDDDAFYCCGIELANSQYVSCVGNTIEDTLLKSIILDNSYDCVISGNVLKNPVQTVTGYDYGLYIEGYVGDGEFGDPGVVGVERNLIEGNYFYGSSYQILATANYACNTIRNNSFFAIHRGIAFRYDDVGYVPTQNLIEGNYFYNFNTLPIYVGGNNDCVIKNNTFGGCAQVEYARYCIFIIECGIVVIDGNKSIYNSTKLENFVKFYTDEPDYETEKVIFTNNYVDVDSTPLLNESGVFNLYECGNINDFFESGSNILYDGETVVFGSVVAWDDTGSTASETTANPYAGDSHIRATIVNEDSWGAIEYRYGQNITTSLAGDLTFYSMVDIPVSVYVAFYDIGTDSTSAYTEIVTSTSYELHTISSINEIVDIPDNITSIIFSTSEVALTTYTLDIDTITVDMSFSPPNISDDVVGNWANYTASFTWGTADPTGTVTTVSRYSEIGKIVNFNVSYSAQDGNDADSLYISLPVTPKNNSSKIVVNALQKVNATWSDPLAYISDSTSSIEFLNFTTCSDAAAVEIVCNGFYEVN